MINFRVLWVGKVRTKLPENALCDRYFKRLKSFVKVEEQVVKPLSSGTGSMNAAKERESKKVCDLLKENEYVVLLDEKGKFLA